MLSYEEALKQVLSQVRFTKTEFVTAENALGRILAEDVTADRDYPPFNRSAMDGVAIRQHGFEQGIRSFKIIDTVYAGQGKEFDVEEGEAVKIMTGASLPSEFNVVVPRELCEFTEHKVLLKTNQVRVNQNIAQKGEDLKSGEVALTKGTKIAHGELALLATLGKASVSVFKKPSVAIIATGDELKAIDEEVFAFQIRESNTYVLRGLLSYLDIVPTSIITVKDEKEVLKKAISEGLQEDVLLLTGGVSMGDTDFVPEILNALQVEKVFHKSAIKPGKPMWFGKHTGGVVFALPGNPLSVQTTFKLYVEPYLQLSEGKGEDVFQPEKMTFKGELKKKNNIDVFVPCVVKNGKVSPLKFNGSGDVTASVGSNGMLRFKSDSEVLKTGDKVEVFLWQR